MIAGQASSMRSARLTAPGRIEVVRVPRPEPGPGEVRVRLEGSGVCGSDLPLWQGRAWFDYPRVPGAPGHEGWGTIDAVGPGTDSLQPGDRVVALGARAYADWDVVAADRVVVLPPEMDGGPFPGEPLGCAVNVVQRADIGAGDVVTVIGVGFLGAVVIALSAAAGARTFAVARRPASRRLAVELGAEVALATDAELVPRISDLTGGTLCDVVVEAAGAQASLDLCGPLVRTRGRLVIAGYHQDGPREVDMQLWNWRGLDVINAHERDPGRYVAGVQTAIAAVLDGRIPLPRLITHRFPLERIGDAFSALEQRPDHFLKAVVHT